MRLGAIVKTRGKVLCLLCIDLKALVERETPWSLLFVWWLHRLDRLLLGRCWDGRHGGVCVSEGRGNVCILYKKLHFIFFCSTQPPSSITMTSQLVMHKKPKTTPLPEVRVRNHVTGTEVTFDNYDVRLLAATAAQNAVRVLVARDEHLYGHSPLGTVFLYKTDVHKPYNAQLVAHGELGSLAFASDELPILDELMLIFIPRAKSRKAAFFFEDIRTHASIESMPLTVRENACKEVRLIGFCLALLRGEPVKAVPESLTITLVEAKTDKSVAIPCEVTDDAFFATLDVKNIAHFFMSSFCN